ncbi:MAG: hypothetical protein H6672_03915 [Anaerolineaceae bacterium]|nr:hypothetical protein [Anaerolineaceae bacterium]
MIVEADWHKGNIRTQIYDVENQTILADSTVTYWATDPPYQFRLYWAANGERAYVFWYDHLVTLYMDGRTELRVNVFSQRHGWPFDFYQGRLLYRSLVADYQDGIIIQDMDSGQWIELEDQDERPPNPYTVRWSPTLDYALIYARSCADDSCAAWLRLVDWKSGEITPVTPTIRIQASSSPECSYTYTCAELWSPGGNFAILTDTDDTVYLLDVRTKEVRQIGSDVYHYQWTPIELLLINYSRLGNPYLYDPTTNHETTLALPVNAQTYNFSLSPDGTLLGLISDPPTIISLDGNLVAQTMPHSHSTQASQFPWNYVWHPGQHWAMANYNISFAGGGVGPGAAVVFDLANTVRRELPSGGDAGFVPDRAVPYLNPGQPDSIKKDPIFVLPLAGGLSGVGWHPTDPDQFVTYSTESGLTFWTLADNTPEITRQTMPTEPIPLQFPQGLKLFWLPEKNLVAFEEKGVLHYVDAITGSSASVTNIEYPILVVTDEEVTIHYAVSDRVLRLDTHDTAFTFRSFLTSNRTAFLVSGINPDDNMPNIPYYINAHTGGITQLAVQDDFFYTADTQDSIATLGSLYSCCIEVINTRTGNMIDEFYGTAFSLALSSDGRRLATTSWGMVAIWDMSEYVGDE